MNRRRRLVLVGLGHAHRLLLEQSERLARHYDIRLIAPHGGYLGATAPDALAGRSVVSRMPRLPGGVDWQRDRAIGFHPLHGRVWTATGTVMPWDVLCLNTGARRLPAWLDAARPGDAPAIWSAHSARRLFDAARRIAASTDERWAVVGDGAWALRLAAALCTRAEAGVLPMPLLLCERREPATRALRRGQKQLARRGVQIVRGVTVRRIGQGRIEAGDGRCFVSDHVIWAAANSPSALACSAGLPMTGQGLRVDRHLRLAARARGLFAAGGVAGLADQHTLADSDMFSQAEVLLHNLISLATGDGQRRIAAATRNHLPDLAASGPGCAGLWPGLRRCRARADQQRWTDWIARAG